MQFRNNQLGVTAKPELLSPAGDWDCLQAAVANGTDAVYLGTREFNARVYARNFSLEELGKAVSYCHTCGIRVYLTLNTLVKNNEITQFFKVLSDAYMLGIDGVIIQQISFLQVIKDNYPGLKVFISTQGAIGNIASASLLKSADRIILPRELPIEEIRRIVNSGVKVEVFVHGALCYSYSGLCLFSSFVANRSGNRGSCAQLCRQKYNGSYPMSTRELCLVGDMPELIKTGVTGFKIEGRMRSPLYVAVATRLYRKAIDSYLAGKFEVPHREKAEIEVVFNREFTRGLMYKDTELVADEKPMNRGALLGVIEAGKITLLRPVEVGDGVGIWGRGEVTGATVKDIAIQGEGVNTANAEETVTLGIGASEGSRIYLTSSRKITIDAGASDHKPEIPYVKRQPVKVALPAVSGGEMLPPQFLAKVYSMKEAAEAAKAGAGIVFYNIFADNYPEPGEWQELALTGAYLPRIMNDIELVAAFNLLKRKNPAAVYSGNLGFLSRRAEYDIPVYMDYSINCFNDLDVTFFRKYNAVPVLSPELTMAELQQFNARDAAILCHGDIVLVNTMIEIKTNSFTDDKGLTFPMRKESSYWQVLNSRPFGMFSDIRGLRDAGFTRFFIDREGKAAQYVRLYTELLNGDTMNRRVRKGHTSGHIYRPVP